MSWTCKLAASFQLSVSKTVSLRTILCEYAYFELGSSRVILLNKAWLVPWLNLDLLACEDGVDFGEGLSRSRTNNTAEHEPAEAHSEHEPAEAYPERPSFAGPDQGAERNPTGHFNSRRSGSGSLNSFVEVSLFKRSLFGWNNGSSREQST